MSQFHSVTYDKSVLLPNWEKPFGWIRHRDCREIIYLNIHGKNNIIGNLTLDRR